eukprot:3701717-Karenia_brevis.AAC.1
MINKSPTISRRITEIFELYSSMDYPGVHQAGVNLAGLEPAPLPGPEGRQQWKASIPPQGP